MDLHCIILYIVTPALVAWQTAPLYWHRLKRWMEKPL
jgi:hypothetical protein